MMSHICKRMWAVLTSALMLLAFALVLTAPKYTGATGTRTARAAAPPMPVMTYYTRTIKLTEPQGGTPGWVSVSYDWIGYSLSALGCGHCPTYIMRLELLNPASNSRITIRTSAWNYSLTSGGFTRGANSHIAFFARYLVWAQPGPAAPTDYSYTPGDLDCTICYYDLNAPQGTKPGGQVNALQGIISGQWAEVVPLDVDFNGNVLAMASANDGQAGAGTLWIGNIATGVKQQLPVTVNAQDVRAGMFSYSGVVAWLEGSRVFAYVQQTGKTIQLADGAENLRGHNSPYIYWYGANGAQRATVNGYTGDVKIEPVPRVGRNFDVAYGSGPFADVIAWQDEPINNVRTLHVASANPGAADLLTRTIAGSEGTMSLGLDKLLFLTNDRPSYPLWDFQLAWLLPAEAAFDKVWQKADGPVAAGKAARSWLWGPQPNYSGMEAYDKGPGGKRRVQYYDKSRMEINNPGADPNNPYYITNGLLATEMIGGEIQVGDVTTIKASVPCTIPVAGDPYKDNPVTPSYAVLANVASIHGEHQAANRIGQPVSDAIDVNGVVSTDAAHARIAKYAAFAPQTSHNIPDLFWTYLSGMQATYGFDWTFVLGYPITEAYWTHMRISGKDYPVLIQAYQRRVLTYTPDFPAEWRVQQGNVGQHYFEWRYILNRDR